MPNFPGRLLTTTETATLSSDADAVIQGLIQGNPPVAAPSPQAGGVPATPMPTATPTAAASPAVTYSATRLTFIAAKIEPLQPEDLFRVVTPEGTFQMSKDDFYVVFDNVAESDSYVQSGLYHYPTVPRKALPFRLDDGASEK